MSGLRRSGRGRGRGERGGGGEGWEGVGESKGRGQTEAARFIVQVSSSLERLITGPHYHVNRAHLLPSLERNTNIYQTMG